MKVSKERFEDHCWKDVVPAEDLKLYETYVRDTFIGPNAAVLAMADAVEAELEKKFSTTHSNVIILANRTMVSSAQWARSVKHSGLRPRNRSLKAVQEAILDDLVFPSEISGKRTKVKVGGGRVLSISLGLKEKDSVFDRKDVIEEVYKHLTTKHVQLDINA